MHKMFHAQNRKIQASNYSVTFTVKHDDGRLISGSSVIFNSVEVTSDVNGEATFLDIPAGTYNYEISAPTTTIVKDQVRREKSSLLVAGNENIVVTLLQGHGRLYSGYTLVNNESLFVPNDWRIPTREDYIELGRLQTPDWDGYDDTLQGRYYRSIGGNYWGYNGGKYGYDTYGFSGFGSGLDTQYMNFTHLGFVDSGSVNALILTATVDFELFDFPIFNYTCSIRLIYNGTGTPTNMTDYDGNVYDVVYLAGRYWTKQNYKVTNLNNGTSIPVSPSKSDFQSRAESEVLMINPGPSELTSENLENYV